MNVLIEGPQIVKGLDTIIEDDIAGGLQLNDFYRNPDRSLYSGPNGTPAVFGQAEFLNDFGVRRVLRGAPNQNTISWKHFFSTELISITTSQRQAIRTP